MDSGVWFASVVLVRDSRTGSEGGERRTDLAEAAGIWDNAVAAVLVVREQAEAALTEVLEVKYEAAGELMSYILKKHSGSLICMLKQLYKYMFGLAIWNFKLGMEQVQNG